MYHLRLPVLLLMLPVFLHSVTASPTYRYFTPSSSSEQESDPAEGEAWIVPAIMSNTFAGPAGTRPERGLSVENSHRIEKRKCNTATCVTQRLADFLVRSSNIGPVYAPTNVGSATYGKRDVRQTFGYLPL